MVGDRSAPPRARFMSNTVSPPRGRGGVVQVHDGRGAPLTASTVRRIRCSRAWVMTMMVTSSGMRSSSMRRRTKSKSVCEAAGKPTSISLKPMRTSSKKSFILRSPFMGSNSAWLPSRRSVESQRGARVMLRLGHWRSGNATGAMAWYLVAGLAIIMVKAPLRRCRAAEHLECGVAAAPARVIRNKSDDVPAAPCAWQSWCGGRGQGDVGWFNGCARRSRVCERVHTPAKH